MTDAQRKRFEAGLIDYYERLELNGTPSFEGKEINTKFGNGWIYRDPYMNHAFTGWQAAEAQQQARIDALTRALEPVQ